MATSSKKKSALWRSDAFVYRIAAPLGRADSMTELMYKIANEEAPDACALRPGLPPRLVAVQARTVRKKPEGRYPDGESMAVNLLSALSDHATDAASDPAPTAPPTATGFQEALMMDDQDGSGRDHNGTQLPRRPGK